MDSRKRKPSRPIHSCHCKIPKEEPSIRTQTTSLHAPFAKKYKRPIQLGHRPKRVAIQPHLKDSHRFGMRDHKNHGFGVKKMTPTRTMTSIMKKSYLHWDAAAAAAKVLTSTTPVVKADSGEGDAHYSSQRNLLSATPTLQTKITSLPQPDPRNLSVKTERDIDTKSKLTITWSRLFPVGRRGLVFLLEVLGRLLV